MDTHESYWSQTTEFLLAELQTAPRGLSATEAAERLRQIGANVLSERREVIPLHLLFSQFTSPLVLILIVAAIISAFVQEWVDAAVVLIIVTSSAFLGFVQEYSATTAVEKLRAQLVLTANVLRDGYPQPIAAEDVVPGDVVLLSAGSLVPADGIVLEAKDFFVNQAVLTGETFPVEKMPGQVPAETSLSGRSNCIFMGTSVRTGTARALIVQTGTATAFGQIATRLTLRPSETEFEQGIRHFGHLLTQVMLILVLVVFAANIFVARPPVDSLLFAVALAVGLAPELLPAIITLNLSRGAQHMAAHGVIVRRLNAIENLGSMNILCTDKTGTLTKGVVHLDEAVDIYGRPGPRVLQDACLNAYFQTGLTNPLDEAILAQAQETGFEPNSYEKVDEIPYDFVRKRMSVVVQETVAAEYTPILITKGGVDNVLAVCVHCQVDGEIIPLDETLRQQIRNRYIQWSAQGIRVLGVARKRLPSQVHYAQADECALTFSGFLLFFDPAKPGVDRTLRELVEKGVQLKLITGDNYQVAVHLAKQIGLPVTSVLTGAGLNGMRDEALWHAAERTTLFVEVDPNQKERIILALQKMGHVVGYLGDGINDAAALHAADVGISVDTAVDVAKEAADFVLLEQNLDVLLEGIEEGRRTFANTIKYIFTTTSANFGNMFSMAGASLFLPFLPLLAKQILLNNFLSDFPGITIAADNVDAEWVQRPHRWDIRFIRNFMVLFGLVSSLFDYLTFGVLLFLLRATPEQFRTGWFVESLMTELVIALVVRTRQPVFRSRPGRLLWISTLAVAVLAVALPYLPFAALLGFVPLPVPVMALLMAITALYMVTAEITKHIFYRRATVMA